LELFAFSQRLAHFTAGHAFFLEGGLREGKAGHGDPEW
jgi:hypothetical protein